MINTHLPDQVVLGIDPGYDRLGWAIGQIENHLLKVKAYGCITTPKKISLPERYVKVGKELTKIIDQYQPTSLAIENLFFSKNTKTALQVSEARGVVLNICLTQGLELFEYNPGTIKQAVTGHGRADKKAMEKMVRLQLKLGDKKIIDDAIDAIAALITHCVIKK